jgi:hypothetical protein
MGSVSDEQAAGEGVNRARSFGAWPALTKGERQQAVWTFGTMAADVLAPRDRSNWGINE